jgi:competence protein CoiA
MLIAKTKDDKPISLAEVSPNNLIRNKLKETKYFCPVCEQSVSLKAGEERIWHFAHVRDKSCYVKHEPETEYHVKGKITLYKWLKKQYKEVELEQYLPEIKQRPDIFVETPWGKVAIEFQCSTISEKEIQKRTNMYVKKRIIPLWILARKRLKKKKECYHLTSMDWRATRFSTKAFLIYFCPVKSAFTILSSLTPFSERKVFAIEKKCTINNVTLENFLYPKIKEIYIPRHWGNEKKKWRMNCHYDNKRVAHFIRNIMRKKRLHLCYTPNVCGIPHRDCYLIKTPAVYWQTWIFITFIYKREIGEKISFKEICHAFSYFIRKDMFCLRTFPCIPKNNVHFSKAIKTYLCLLCQLNYLRKENQNDYKIVNEITHPTSNYEAMVLDSKLMKKLIRVYY